VGRRGKIWIADAKINDVYAPGRDLFFLTIDLPEKIRREPL
jgi:hypothetical protein